MQKIMKFTPYFLMGIAILMIAGCATEKITADYVMPARKVADVSAVNVVAIRVKADIKGSFDADNKKSAGLIKQLTSMRLYKEGYYSAIDAIWGDPQGTGKLQKMLKEKDAGHGYAMYSTEQGMEKVILDLDVAITLDSKSVTEEEEFELTTLPYDVKDAHGHRPPTSKPNLKKAMVKKVRQPVTTWVTTADGILKAKFVGPKGTSAPVAYENSFKITIPEGAISNKAKPSFIKALAAAVTPAINEIIADISPYKVSQEFTANEDGNESVFVLMNAKAFPEVIYTVDNMRKKEEANYADLENQGLAYEVLGEFTSARDCYQEALKMEEGSPFATEGIERINDILKGKKAIKQSGAKKIKTGFSNSAISTDQAK